LIDFVQLLLLGTVAGMTIFLGLPIAFLKNVNQQTKSFLNAIAIGILFFLIIDVFSHAWEVTEESVLSWFAGKTISVNPIANLSALLGGIAAGLLGLSYYETKLFPKVLNDGRTKPTIEQGTNKREVPVYNLSIDDMGTYRLAIMIASAIGAHNFSEGLAIGQSYAAGSIGLAIVLIIGFGAHNATEGFGISSPLMRLDKRPSLRFLVGVGLIGGLPTFIGTLVGSLIGMSTFTFILFLSMAGGALVYVSLLMYSTARRQSNNYVMMLGIFIGLCAGFITDLLITLGGV
jgi:ZIP family zinc transporter